jgi:hypothetical protein
MNISPRVVSSSHGVLSTNEKKWVRVKGRPDGADVARVVGEKQMEGGVGHCYLLLFEQTGEVATYRSNDTEQVAVPD